MSDLIKRSDAIEAYADIYWIDDRLNLAYREELDQIDEKIRNIPTVEVADRPQGEWIAVDSYSAFGGSEEQWYAHGNPTAYHYCSVCKEQVHLDEFGKEMLTNFCPNCGARMYGEAKESE